jgi:replication factor A1
VQNRRIVIVLDLDIVEADHKDKIGAPQNIDTVVASGTAGGAGGVKAESNTTTTATSGSRTTAPPQQQQRQAAPVARNNSNVRTTPISALNPYQNRWTIKARVTSRGDKRSWNNARGQGTLFSADLLDEHGGEIRCTFFKEACEKFYDMLEVSAGGRGQG